VSPSSLARIEADEVSPKIATVRRLAEALGLEAHTLLGQDPSAPDSGGRDRHDGQSRRLVAAFQGLSHGQRRLILGITEELARLSPRDVDVDSPPAGGPDPPDADAQDLPAQGGETARRTRGHYVQGWDRRTAYDHLKRQDRLVHTAGAQFSKPFEPIERGDVLWIVFVDSGRLHLIARMVVSSRSEYRRHLGSDRSLDEVIFTQSEVESILGRHDLWPAPEHLLAQDESELRDVRVPAKTVRRLEFRTSAGASKVATDDSGRVQGQAFRSVRILAPDSAAEFERLWRAQAKASR
jgi:transcriptional regulator with XRE-family HTH domain